MINDVIQCLCGDGYIIVHNHVYTVVLYIFVVNGVYYSTMQQLYQLPFILSWFKLNKNTFTTTLLACVYRGCVLYVTPEREHSLVRTGQYHTQYSGHLEAHVHTYSTYEHQLSMSSIPYPGKLLSLAAP